MHVLVFLSFIGLKGLTVEEKSKCFIQRVEKKGNQWVSNIILRFIQFHLDRVIRKEITGTTVRNHLKRIKLFCEIPDIPIAWKKISRGLLKGKNWLFGADYANTCI